MVADRKAAAVGTMIAVAVAAGVTVLTQALWHGEPINPVKLFCSGLLLGALIGRIYYNAKTPRPNAAPVN